MVIVVMMITWRSTKWNEIITGKHKIWSKGKMILKKQQQQFELWLINNNNNNNKKNNRHWQQQQQAVVKVTFFIFGSWNKNSGIPEQNRRDRLKPNTFLREIWYSKTNSDRSTQNIKKILCFSFFFDVEIYQ